jgi:hypothetical protein
MVKLAVSYHRCNLIVHTYDQRNFWHRHHDCCDPKRLDSFFFQTGVDHHHGNHFVDIEADIEVEHCYTAIEIIEFGHQVNADQEAFATFIRLVFSKVNINHHLNFRLLFTNLVETLKILRPIAFEEYPQPL